MELRGNAQVVTALVPLAEMFGYATDLRSTTQGRATYTMQFDSYEEVPPNIAEQRDRAPDRGARACIKQIPSGGFAHRRIPHKRDFKGA